MEDDIDTIMGHVISSLDIFRSCHLMLQDDYYEEIYGSKDGFVIESFYEKYDIDLSSILTDDLERHKKLTFIKPTNN